MIIRLFWFSIPNHKFYEYALISKQCDILNVFLMFLFNLCLMPINSIFRQEKAASRWRHAIRLLI
ncbi:MAG TPA: hypothetical protein DFK21_06135 [Salmonella bongori]|uniref:Uncharacterized protein n=2 Tax=Salmonella bongori TaxID=54736 RepID=A0A248KAF9_SALBN|nr:hypothetical protein LFZ56_12395 [Salmonella bongori serovar 66:z41:- str. SA19983605]ECC8732261.1 hypothetical protein [Salmonella bongori]ECG8258572.1 hypothetical protein [Salmonella bongori serovar 48:i:-]HAC6694839.1 hypothetical protein [Salmonella bongori serovar 44:r:-]ECC9750648.1 hypothetical protein [Salmonella bongori]